MRVFGSVFRGSQQLFGRGLIVFIEDWRRSHRVEIISALLEKISTRELGEEPWSTRRFFFNMFLMSFVLLFDCLLHFVHIRRVFRHWWTLWCILVLDTGYWFIFEFILIVIQLCVLMHDFLIARAQIHAWYIRKGLRNHYTYLPQLKEIKHRPKGRRLCISI